MKVKFKEDPKAWRKTTLLTVLGAVIVCTVLRWRGVLPWNYWATTVILLAVVAITAWFWPRRYRGFYRVSTRIGFYSSQAFARVILALVFVLLLTPWSWVMRLAGKDPLRLKRIRTSASYWHPARQTSPLDRQF
jgi:hypothetical protein